jgi:hypothetical protein
MLFALQFELLIVLKNIYSYIKSFMMYILRECSDYFFIWLFLFVLIDIRDTENC